MNKSEEEKDRLVFNGLVFVRFFIPSQIFAVLYTIDFLTTSFYTNFVPLP